MESVIFGGISARRATPATVLTAVENRHKELRARETTEDKIL